MHTWPLRPEKYQAMLERMRSLALAESDCDETFVRARGPGGQKVNKTSTAVVLKHKPTGIVVKASEERQQWLNRYRARLFLCDELETRLLGNKSPKSLAALKIRKQKDRRRRR